ncbi:MAG: polysaccharide pyruvyl transferase CsaB [Filifactoraceae bacterium]
MYKILVSGYYGFNNVGDEAILKGLVEGIRREVPNSKLVVLSKYPDFTEKKYDVIAIRRMNFFSIMREMRSMDLLISGGGSLLQDVTSKRSILYYLLLIYMAKSIFNKKVMIFSQGIGPVNKPYHRALVKKILNRVDVINVRDDQSKKELIEMGVTGNISVTTDTVFGMDRPSKTKGQKILRNLKIKEGKLTLGISVRAWESYTENTINEISELIISLTKNFDINIVLIPFHYYEDLKIMQSIYSNVKSVEDKVFILKDYLYVDDYLSVVGNMDIMLSMRLHGLIFATLMGSYPVGISYDPKIQSFMTLLERPLAMDVSKISGIELFYEIKYAIENLENLKTGNEEKVESFMKRSSVHNKLLKDLLEE